MNRIIRLIGETCVLHAIVIILFIAMCVIACLFYHAMTTYEICPCSVVSIDAYLEMINGMVGFWMSLLAVILLICGIWQYLHIQKVDDKIKDTEEKMNKSMENIEIMQEKMKNMNEISILLRSLGALNDPVLLLIDSERQREVRKYLELINKKLNIFIELLDKSEKSSRDFVDYLDIILLNLSLCVGRILFMYPNIKVNLAMRQFINENNEQRLTLNQNNFRDNYIKLTNRLDNLLLMM